jgi:spore coat protein H
VTFNGADKGIYVVVEGIDKDFLRLHFGETNDEGNLYEGPCCGDFAVDATYRQDELELDDEKKDDRTRDDINALAQIIASGPDATFAADVEKRLDLDQFMKIYALEVLLLHWDGFAFTSNNYYLYNNPVDSRFVFFPHGMDQILADLSFDFNAQALKSRLPQRIHEIAALDARYKTHFAALETTAWNASAMQASIEQTVAMLKKAGSGTQTSVDLAQLDAKSIELRNAITVVDANLKQ